MGAGKGRTRRARVSATVPVGSIVATRAVKRIKEDYEAAITTASFNGSDCANGNEAVQKLIRSQKIIARIHEAVKEEFLKRGVAADCIHPPLGENRPEIRVEGFLKWKDQDIVVYPDADKQDEDDMITVNVRSQMSSLDKNFDTLYERTFAEALNLHLKHPRMCLGEVYLIPTHEYDQKAMEREEIAFKKTTKLEKYIEAFQRINKRDGVEDSEHKYERACLLIVDFRQKTPKVYSSGHELLRDGLIDKYVSMRDLGLDDFATDLLRAHEVRLEG